jgi:hypothetical protein
MLKNLRSRLEKLETARSSDVIEIIYRDLDGPGVLTRIRDGRVVSRRELTPEEAARLVKGAISIRRSYGGPR